MDGRSAMDTSNPIVELCARGMAAEATDGADAARGLFQEAWERRSDDFDACVAAHYLARHQPSAEERLEWNACALRHAELSRDSRVVGFYPSLHLTLGSSYEDLGDLANARDHYACAQRHLEALDDDGYGAMMRRGVTAALSRTDAGD